MDQPARRETPPAAPARFAAPADGRLSPAMRAAWTRDGFLVLEDFAAPADCAQLVARIGEIVRASGPGDAATVFSTTSYQHAGDDYFATSGDKIRCFFEEEAFDGEGRLKQPVELSLNKVGHALHDLDPAFDRFSRLPKLAALVADLGVKQSLLLQLMYIFKQPGIGGEVVCHTDASFLITEPPSVIGLWFALEDATLENGCLWALPGRHTQPLRAHFRRTPAGLKLETVDPRPWSTEGAVPIEARRGTLVFLHGFLPHYSGANRSAKSRHAYTLHVIDGACRYSDDNWLQRAPDMPLRGF